MLIEYCSHHWLIDERIPGQRFSGAVCKLCGRERMFDNWATEDEPMSWMDRSDVLKEAVRARASVR